MVQRLTSTGGGITSDIKILFYELLADILFKIFWSQPNDNALFLRLCGSSGGRRKTDPTLNILCGTGPFAFRNEPPPLSVVMLLLHP